jgi:site-specific recombinase XerD
VLLNKTAQDGYRKSAVEKVRTHTRACFKYAIDEELLQKDPARKLVMPNIKKKSCERFLSVDELQALLSQASPREHVVFADSGRLWLAASRDPRFADRGF